MSKVRYTELHIQHKMSKATCPNFTDEYFDADQLAYNATGSSTEKEYSTTTYFSMYKLITYFLEFLHLRINV